MTALALAPRPTSIEFLPSNQFIGWLLPDAIDDAAALLAMVCARGFDRTGARYPADYRDNDRLVFDDPALAAALFATLRDRLPAELVEDGARWQLCGLNPRFRACRYTGGQAFCIHRDGPFAPSDDMRSWLTVQLYLDDDPTRTGCHTRFYADPRGETRWASIAPAAGAAIVFDHRAWHDGEAVTAGIKHVLRTDAMYRRVGPAPLADPTVVGRHRGYAWRAIACHDGSIASTGRDGTIRRWPAGTALDLGRGSITALVEDAHGRLWCGTRAGEVLVLDDSPRVMASGLGAITSAALSGDLVAMSTSLGTIVAFDAGSGSSDARALWSASAHDGWAWDIAASSTGFVSCGHDGRIVEIDRAGRVHIITELATPLRAIATTRTPTSTTAMPAPFGVRIIAGDARGWLHLVGHDGRILGARRAHSAATTSLALDGDDVISASEDGTVKRWPGLARTTNAEAVTLVATSDFVTSVALDASGDVITAGYDGAIRRLAR